MRLGAVRSEQVTGDAQGASLPWRGRDVEIGQVERAARAEHAPHFLEQRDLLVGLQCMQRKCTDHFVERSAAGLYTLLKTG